MKTLIFFSLLVTGVNLAHADEIVTQVLPGQHAVVVSHGKNVTWAVDEKVCLFRNEEKLTCGTVTHAGAKQATVKLTDYTKGVKVGDGAKLDESALKREVSSENAEPAAPPVAAEGAVKKSVGLLPAHEPMYRHIMLGANSSFSTTTYHLNFQGFISDHVTLGISPGMFRVTNATLTLNTFGAVFTANYYSESAFRGMWAQFGTGFYAFKAASGSITETTFSPAMLATLGWRAEWALGFNVGLALGAQYITNPQRSSVAIPFNALQPVLVTDIGLPF